MLNYFLDAFFPHRCVGCGKVGQPICAACIPFVLNLQEDIEGVGTVIFCYRYGGVVQKAVHALKFQRYAAPAKLLIEKAGFSLLYPVVPMASGKRAVAERGYLQTAEIGKAFAGSTISLHLRKTSSGRQVGLGRQERLAAPPTFAVIGKPPSRVLLLDDVLTTGASLRAAAIALSEHGAKVVGAIVLARD